MAIEAFLHIVNCPKSQGARFVYSLDEEYSISKDQTIFRSSLGFSFLDYSVTYGVLELPPSLLLLGFCLGQDAS
jgi:hypothetical protein